MRKTPSMRVVLLDIVKNSVAKVEIAQMVKGKG